jgi:hypothetical protein
MSYILQIRDIPFLALESAAEYVRDKHKLDSSLWHKLDRNQIISEFETEFNVKIHSGSQILDMNTDIEFNSREEYTWFLLRWA